MLRFLGFRASLNLSGKRSEGDFYDDVPTWATSGAYRTNTEDYIENGGLTQTYKTITPSMVKLPSSSDSEVPKPPRRSKSSKDNIKKISKSTSDLTQTEPNTNLSDASHSKSSGNVSLNPRGSNTHRNMVYVPDSNLEDTKKEKSKKKIFKYKESKKNKSPKTTSKEVKGDSTNADKEAKKAAKEAKRAAKEARKFEKELERQEKLRLEEQKKQDKLDSQILANEEKLQKRKEKAEQKTKLKKDKKEKDKNKLGNKTSQTVVAQKPLTNPLAQSARNTDTLQSSISKTSAPPPYSENKEDVLPKALKNETKKVLRNETKTEVLYATVNKENKIDVSPKGVQNENDSTGNTSFGKPINNAGSSWDMISQHRDQINRTPTASGTKMKILEDSPYVTGRKSIYI